MEKELKEREIITTEEDIDKNNTAKMENNENENREFYVYKHIRLDNNTCFYVGKGKGNRIYVPKRNKHHDNICKTCDYEVVKIKENLTEEEAFALEREIIEDYVFVFGYGINIEGYNDYDHELPHLTNMTWGGEGISGIQLSEEHKKKIGEANKGIQLSEEHKKKISEANKGRHHSEEAKRKISEAFKGKHRSEETKQKISESKKGRHHSEEAKQKMSESHKGEKKLSKKVICVTTGEIFNSFKDARNYYKSSNISDCCKGVRKSAGKLQDGTPLKWKYVKDYNDDDFKGILINPITE